MAETIEKKVGKETVVTKEIALDAFRLMATAKSLTELYEENKEVSRQICSCNIAWTRGYSNCNRLTIKTTRFCFSLLPR
jgi:hypothetical protein